MASGPSPSPQRQQDSGVIADLSGIPFFPKLCGEIKESVKVGTSNAGPLSRGFDDVIIGFISGVPSGSAFVQGGTLNANVRELHLSQPELVAGKIQENFLVHRFPVNIILHKAEICGAVLKVFDTLTKTPDYQGLVTLIVIAPVNESPVFDLWMKARNSESPTKGHVQIFKVQDSKAS